MAIRKNFVVKNGLEVDERILYVDAVTDKVGIGTIYPEYQAHVIGSIGCTDINITRNASVSGILTANEIDFTGNGISIGDTTGLPGQYLRSTGTGVEWASFPTSLRSTFTYTATDLQSTFDYAYNVGFLDVYINGVKLKGNGVTDVSEYTAVTGTEVVLTEPAFQGDFVELVAYNPSSVAAGGDGILGFTILEEGSIVGNDNGVTSINFIGAAVTAVGSGAGVTVYVENYWESTSVGINTLSNVGIGTTNPTSALTVRGGDISVGVNTSSGLILTSPNGTQYRIIVANDGSLSTTIV
jgi:hypothetical protein